MPIAFLLLVAAALGVIWGVTGELNGQPAPEQYRPWLLGLAGLALVLAVVIVIIDMVLEHLEDARREQRKAMERAREHRG